MSWHLFHTPPVSRKPAAEKALQEANQRLERVQGKDEEVKELSQGLRKQRESDHFTQLIREAMRRI